jgi:hypothetical protein
MMDAERFFTRLATLDVSAEPAPARLKARIYSALVQDMAHTGRLLSLRETKAAGAKLCVFEETVAALPVGEAAGSANICRVCHARILGERLNRAPIFWAACPYAEFHHG